jgi:asparagine synthase (glutamine-hydrolysing)
LPGARTLPFDREELPMGAIYGLVGWTDLEAAQMLGGRLEHRGRYGAEWSPGHALVLGARGSRLLVDLQEHGPVAFDGAIDNRRELGQWLGRRDAATLGPAEDAQLLFEVVSVRGVEGLARVGGVFAAALWLGSERRLLLVRDRSGFAPLYFAPLGERAVFASEMKALLALDEIPARLDRASLQLALATGRVPIGASCLEGIYPVAPGTCLELRQGRLAASRFWQLPASAASAGTEAEQLARLRASFLDSVRRQTAAYGRVGIGLSGGFHSALVAAGVRTVAGGREVHTYTAAYGADDPCLARGERIARELGTRHHPLIVAPSDLPALLPWIAWLLEAPVGAEELPLLFLAAREASGTVDLFLSGQGQAELFGETWPQRLASVALRYQLLRGPLEELYHLETAGIAPRSSVARLLHAVLGRNADPPAIIGAPAVAELDAPPLPGPDAFGEVLRAELLRRPAAPGAERLFAAAGARLNAATTDPAFVTVALELADTQNRRSAGLRRAGARLLPRIGLERAPSGPSGFRSAPLEAALDGIAAELLSPARVRARGIFPPRYVESVATRQGGRRDRGRNRRLWSLLLTEAWCQSYLDRRGAAPAGRVPSARRPAASDAGVPLR